MKFVGKITQNIIEKFKNELNNSHNQIRIRRNIIEPLISLIMKCVNNQLYPFLYIICIIFVLTFLLTIIILVLIMSK